MAERLLPGRLATCDFFLGGEGRGMGVGTGGAEGAAAPPTFGTGEQAIARDQLNSRDIFREIGLLP